MSGEKGKSQGPVAPKGQGLPSSCVLVWKRLVRAACCAAGHCNPPAGTGTSKAIPPLPYQRASRARRCRIYQIGHLVQGGERKLVIGHAARSYVARYHYIEALDTVFEQAVRSQREAGFNR